MSGSWKTAWITGASSGIGRELALKLARDGVRVAASARSADRLDELAQAQPSIVPVPVDVELSPNLGDGLMAQAAALG
jgi:NADP-dependent 3-hydroxy acid dehydrogenase YdfG